MSMRNCSSMKRSSREQHRCLFFSRFVKKKIFSPDADNHYSYIHAVIQKRFPFQVFSAKKKQQIALAATRKNGEDGKWDGSPNIFDRLQFFFTFPFFTFLFLEMTKTAILWRAVHSYRTSEDSVSIHISCRCPDAKL